MNKFQISIRRTRFRILGEIPYHNPSQADQTPECPEANLALFNKNWLSVYLCVFRASVVFVFIEFSAIDSLLRKYNNHGATESIEGHREIYFSQPILSVNQNLSANICVTICAILREIFIWLFCDFEFWV